MTASRQVRGCSARAGLLVTNYMIGMYVRTYMGGDTYEWIRRSVNAFNIRTYVQTSILHIRWHCTHRYITVQHFSCTFVCSERYTDVSNVGNPTLYTVVREPTHHHWTTRATNVRTKQTQLWRSRICVIYVCCTTEWLFKKRIVRVIATSLQVADYKRLWSEQHTV